MRSHTANAAHGEMMAKKMSPAFADDTSNMYEAHAVPSAKYATSGNRNLTTALIE